MNILILIIGLFLGFFARPVFAAEINITNVPMDSIPVGSTFPVTFKVVSLDPDTRYDFRFYGGPTGDNYSIKIYNQLTDRFLSYDDDWANMPSFYTDSSGNATVGAIANIPADKTYCPDIQNHCYFLFVHLVTDTNQVGFTDYTHEIKVSSPFLIPTPTTSSASHNQIPTLTPTPTPNMKIYGVTTDSTIPAPTSTVQESTSSDLLSPTVNPNPTIIIVGSNSVDNKNNLSPQKPNFILFIVLGLGVVFVAILLIFLKIKQK